MVKLAGPLFSLEASGQLGDALVFSKWKGRPYAREKVTPANPRSGGQVGVRSMLKFLSQFWASLDTATQGDWAARAEDMVVSPFNAYVSYNQRRWRNFLYPSQLDPADETGVAPSAPVVTGTAGVRQASLSIADGATPPDWGWAIFRSLTTGFTPTWTNCIAVVDATGGTPVTYIDTPLDADTYYYKVIGFHTTGKGGTTSAEEDVVIT